MNIEKLVPFAIAFALAVSCTRHLSEFTNAIRRGEFQLIQDTKASKWPKIITVHTSYLRRGGSLQVVFNVKPKDSFLYAIRSC